MNSSVHQAIEEANREFMEAVRARDADRFARLYTDDAILLLPGKEPLTGPDGARTFFAGFEARGIREIRLTTLEIEAVGKTAWEPGSSELIAGDGTVASRGKYVMIWKQTAAGWRLHRDIMNAST